MGLLQKIAKPPRISTLFDQLSKAVSEIFVAQGATHLLAMMDDFLTCPGLLQGTDKLQTGLTVGGAAGAFWIQC
jgi:hypothetical protein